MADYSITPGEEGVFIAVVVVTLLIMVIAWLVLRAAVKIVRHSEVMIIERFGRYNRTLTPGLHFIIPIVDSPRRINWRYVNVKSKTSEMEVVSIHTDRIDMREHVIDFGKQHVITKDTVQIEIDALVYFRIADPRVAVFKVQNVPDNVELLTQATLRNIIAHMTLDDTFSSREQINDDLMSKIQRDAERWGVLVTRVEIYNIIPPRDIKSAMENQIKSERERRSAVLHADGEREAAIIRSRGDAAKLILLAEGDRSSSILLAKGKAAAKTAKATAEARSIQYVAEAVEASGSRAVDYLTAMEYLNALKGITTKGGNRSGEAVLIPVETLDGVKELIECNSGKQG